MSWSVIVLPEVYTDLAAPSDWYEGKPAPPIEWVGYNFLNTLRLRVCGRKTPVNGVFLSDLFTHLSCSFRTPASNTLFHQPASQRVGELPGTIGAAAPFENER